MSVSNDVGYLFTVFVFNNNEDKLPIIRITLSFVLLIPFVSNQIMRINN